jgi:hypothetical protein
MTQIKTERAGYRFWFVSQGENSSTKKQKQWGILPFCFIRVIRVNELFRPERV